MELCFEVVHRFHSYYIIFSPVKVSVTSEYRFLCTLNECEGKSFPKNTFYSGESTTFSKAHVTTGSKHILQVVFPISADQ